MTFRQFLTHCTILQIRELLWRWRHKPYIYYQHLVFFCVDELPMFSLCDGWGRGRVVFVSLTFLTYVKLSALGLCATAPTRADPGSAAVMSKLRISLWPWMYLKCLLSSIRITLTSVHWTDYSERLELHPSSHDLSDLSASSWSL